jgi:hypothetical protein
MTMMKMKFSQTQIKHILISVLFILGLYHSLMCLAKMNAFHMDKESLALFKHILTRFYHLAWALMAGFGLSFSWKKLYNWIWLYLGSKVVYNIITLAPKIKTALNKSLLDGFYIVILIIVILLILRNEKDS